MSIKPGNEVTITSRNDVLHAFEKAGTVFNVEAVYGEGNDAFIEVSFQNGERFVSVLRGDEVVKVRT